MGPLAAGAVVLIPFPFSDLSQTKLRPALVLADTGRNDWIFCQITSQPYGDSRAIPLTDADFEHGALRIMSYVRPGKLFTDNARLVVGEVGCLKRAVLSRIARAVVSIITP